MFRPGSTPTSSRPSSVVPERRLEPIPMAPVRWRAIPVRSALDPALGRTGCDANLDPYVGCAKGCLFCWARSFDVPNSRQGSLSELGAKLELPQALAAALPRAESIRLRLGGRCEPFPDLEASLGLTRACLRVLAKSPASSRITLEVCTRSASVLDEVDLLLTLGSSVTIGLSTCPRTLAESLEPGAPSVQERLELVTQLSRAGLSVGVELHPILPGLGDDRLSLRRAVCAAASAGATYLRGSLLQVRDDARKSLLEWVGEAAPDQTPRYRRLYGGRGSRRRRRNAELQVAERVSCTLAELRCDYRLAPEPPWPPRSAAGPVAGANAPHQFDLFEAA